MIPEYSPACTETSLKALYAVKDALRRKAFIEASNLVFDTLAIIQNEFDWCYRTDPVLPFMRDYFIELHAAISRIVNATPEVKKEQATLLSINIAATMHDVSSVCNNQPVYSDVEGRPDRLERDERINLYSRHRVE